MASFMFKTDDFTDGFVSPSRSLGEGDQKFLSKKIQISVFEKIYQMKSILCLYETFLTAFMAMLLRFHSLFLI